MPLLRSSMLPFLLLLQLIACFALRGAAPAGNGDVSYRARLPVTKEQRRTLVSTEYGEIAAVDISHGVTRPYHLQFITLEPNSLLLPSLLHADMVFYVNTGRGTLSWIADNDVRRVELRRGDVYRLPPGTVFFLQGNLDSERVKLEIYAIFDNADDYYDPSVGVYSRISDMVLGFDRKILQAAFKVPEDVIEALSNTTREPAIVHRVATEKQTQVGKIPKNALQGEIWLLNALFRASGSSMLDVQNKKKKVAAFNIHEEDPDFENCYGWSSIATEKKLQALKGSNIGVFMVNLTKGSMMGPHWNPMVAEMAVVIQGQGMVRMVCASNVNESECKNIRFRAQEGDAFATPRFRPMAQMSFNDGPFIFMGFTTTTMRNHPQFIAGKSSVLRTLDRQVAAASFNVPNTTIDRLLAAQDNSTIFECISCAEEEESSMEEEEEREREEEEARKREEEKRKKEEEEKQREKEKEERRRREEEEKRQREEEERRKEEEEERERQKQKEEEEERERQEQRDREEEERERQREEEEEIEREQKERKKEEEEERERQKQRDREEEERERQEEEKARRKEAKEEHKRQQEEEERREEERERERQRKEEKRRESTVKILETRAKERQHSAVWGGREVGTRVLLKMMWRERLG